MLILGLAYKANVDDDRESPSYVLMQKLIDRKAIVDYNDPYVPIIRPTREHAHFAGIRSKDVQQDGYDLLLIATAHREYSLIDFSRYEIPIVDTRNCVTNPPAKYYKA